MDQGRTQVDEADKLMARARNIKPGFFKNEFLAEIPYEGRLLFIGLWTLADREGRLEDRPIRINAELFPFGLIDIESMLDQLQTKGFLLRYEVDGSRYIQIVNFVKHQDPHYREKASEIPPPKGHANKIIAANVTRTQRARILERDGYKCQACGSPNHLCIDHILPVSRGGDSSDDNLQVLCLSCNTAKGNKVDSTSSRTQPNNVADVPLNPDSFNLIPDSPIPSTTSVPPPVEEKPKRVRRSKEEKISGFSDQVREVVNTLGPQWRTEDPVDGRKITQDVGTFAQRISEILAAHPEVTHTHLIEAGAAYIASTRNRYKAPQFFFGPGMGSEGPPWLGYVRSIMTRKETPRELAS